jgi:hypothetical protein
VGLDGSVACARRRGVVGRVDGPAEREHAATARALPRSHSDECVYAEVRGGRSSRKRASRPSARSPEIRSIAVTDGGGTSGEVPLRSTREGPGQHAQSAHDGGQSLGSASSAHAWGSSSQHASPRRATPVCWNANVSTSTRTSKQRARIPRMDWKSLSRCGERVKPRRRPSRPRRPVCTRDQV